MMVVDCWINYCVTDKYWKPHFLEWKTRSSVLKFSPQNTENRIFRALKFQIFSGAERA